MSRHWMSTVDGAPDREFAPALGMTGADQQIARDPTALAWLSKVWVEMADRVRSWRAFDEEKLGQFLSKAGVDLVKAVKANADALPPPTNLIDLEGCLGKLRGASFLADSAESACLLINERAERAPHRQAAG